MNHVAEYKPMRGRLLCLGIACLSLVSGCEPEVDSQAKPRFVPPPRPPALHLPLTPEQAYAAIPTRRTVLDLEESCVDPSVRWYLEGVFACIDEAIVLRVTTLDEFFAGKYKFRIYATRHERLRDYLKSMTPPVQLRAYHDKLLEGLDAQRTFFEEWAEAGSEFATGTDVFSHPEVRRCSSALLDAYRILSDEIGPEAVDQHEAFRDYHCALDFL